MPATHRVQAMTQTVRMLVRGRVIETVDQTVDMPAAVVLLATDASC